MFEKNRLLLSSSVHLGDFILSVLFQFQIGPNHLMIDTIILTPIRLGLEIPKLLW